MMHNRAIDLNLLIILECLYRRQNVSLVAKELGSTQSAISHSLARLRLHYKDPLFVRVSKGVAPTEFAKSIRPEVEDFVKLALQLSQKLYTFDAAKAEGRIVIATSDYIEVVIGTRLLERMQKEAPHVQLSLRPLLGSLPKEQLEEGTYDLAIAGFFQDLPEGFFRQKLFKDSFSTAYRIDHPGIQNNLTLEEYFEAEHALITLQGDFVDNDPKVMHGKKKSRNIKYGTASFTGPAWTISKSDLLLTGPTLLLQKYKEFFPICVQPCPLEMKPIEVQMVWHGLTSQDPLRKWVRQLIKEVCSSPVFLKNG